MEDTGAVLGIKELWLEGRCYDMEFRFAQLSTCMGSFGDRQSKPPFWNPDLDSAYGDASVISQEERRPWRADSYTNTRRADGKNTQGIIPAN
jgi:hypothetical protein